MPRRRLVKFDHVGGPVMAGIHAAIIASTVNATVDTIVVPTGRGNHRRNNRSMYTLHYCMHIQLHDHLSSDWDISMTTCSMRRSYTAVVCCAKTHGNHAAGREFDSISEANICLWQHQKEPGGSTAVKNAAAWATCCISRAGTFAGWIVEKLTLCTICTPNFTVRFLENKCVLYPRFYGNHISRASE